MSAIEPVRAARSARPGLAAAGAARGDHRRRRDGDVRRDLLPPVVPAGALQRTVRRAGERQPRARTADRRAPRARSSTAKASRSWRSTTTNAVQIVPSELPTGISSQVAAYQSSLQEAETARATAAARLSSYRDSLGDTRRLTRAQRVELERLRRAAATPRVAVPPLPRSAVGLDELFRRLGRVIGMSPRTIEERVVEGMATTPYAPVTIKTDAGTGPLTVLGERQNEFPGVVQEPVSIREYPYGEMAAQVFGYVGQVTETELKTAGVPRRAARHGRRPGRARVLLRPLPARRAGGAAGGGQRAKASPCQASSRRRRRTAGLQPADDARPGPAAGERKGAAGRHGTRARRRQTGDRGGVRGARPAQR